MVKTLLTQVDIILMFTNRINIMHSKNKGTKKLTNKHRYTGPRKFHNIKKRK